MKEKESSNEQAQSRKKYYSEVAYIQDGAEDFEDLLEKEDYKGILALADQYDQGDAIEQRNTFLSPAQYPGDDIIDEDDRYAVVVNNSVGGTYSVFRKVDESDVRDAIERYGLDSEASDDVKEVYRNMVEKDRQFNDVEKILMQRYGTEDDKEHYYMLIAPIRNKEYKTDLAPIIQDLEHDASLTPSRRSRTLRSEAS